MSDPFHKQETLDEYLAADAIGSSLLRTVISKSELHALHEQNTPRLSATFDFGSCFHACVLEPQKLDEFAVRPSGINASTKAGKAALIDWAQKTGGGAIPEGVKTIDQITLWLTTAAPTPRVMLPGAGDRDRLRGMVEGLHANSLAARIMTASGWTEESVYWLESEQLCKARPDRLVMHPDHGYPVFVDLKTTADAHPRKFTRNVIDYGYHVQAAHVRAGLDTLAPAERGAVIIAVEKAPPYACAVYELDDALLTYGQSERTRALALWQRAKETGVYPAYPNGVLEAPDWMIKSNG